MNIISNNFTNVVVTYSVFLCQKTYHKSNKALLCCSAPCVIKEQTRGAELTPAQWGRGRQVSKGKVSELDNSFCYCQCNKKAIISCHSDERCEITRCYIIQVICTYAVILFCFAFIVCIVVCIVNCGHIPCFCAQIWPNKDDSDPHSGVAGKINTFPYSQKEKYRLNICRIRSFSNAQTDYFQILPLERT